MPSSSISTRTTTDFPEHHGISRQEEQNRLFCYREHCCASSGSVSGMKKLRDGLGFLDEHQGGSHDAAPNGKTTCSAEVTAEHRRLKILVGTFHGSVDEFRRYRAHVRLHACSYLSKGLQLAPAYYRLKKIPAVSSIISTLLRVQDMKGSSLSPFPSLSVKCVFEKRL